MTIFLQNWCFKLSPFCQWVVTALLRGLVTGAGEISAEISASAEVLTFQNQCPLPVSAGIPMCSFPKVRKSHLVNETL